MNSDMNEARQKMVANRKELDDIEKASVRNLRLAESNLFMTGIISLWGTCFLVVAIIMAYVWMYNFFVNQSFPWVLGFWYIGIDFGIVWIPAWLGYMVWRILAVRAKQRRAELMKDQRKAEETHKKVMELRKNAETLVQKLEVLK